MEGRKVTTPNECLGVGVNEGWQLGKWETANESLMGSFVTP